MPPAQVQQQYGQQLAAGKQPSIMELIAALGPGVGRGAPLPGQTMPQQGMPGGMPRPGMPQMGPPGGVPQAVMNPGLGGSSQAQMQIQSLSMPLPQQLRPIYMSLAMQHLQKFGEVLGPEEFSRELGAAGSQQQMPQRPQMGGPPMSPGPMGMPGLSPELARAMQGIGPQIGGARPSQGPQPRPMQAPVQPFVPSDQYRRMR